MTILTALNRINLRRKLARLYRLTRATMAIIFLGLLCAGVQQGNATVTTLADRDLVRAAFQTQDEVILAGCIGTNCASPKTTIFAPALDVVCPAAKLKTCIFYIHLESQAQVSSRDAGLFRILVNNKAPTPTQTDADGSFTWLDNDPDSNVLTLFEAKSVTVAASVKNTTKANQVHTIEVQIGCKDTNGDGGCAAKSGFSTLEVKVFTP